MFNYQDPTTVGRFTTSFFKEWPEDKCTFSILKLGEKLQIIESKGFSYANIKVLDLSDCINLRVISEHAFQWCTQLEHVILPKHITKLPKYAFCGLDKLLSVTGSNLIDFFPETFLDCNSLIEIQIDQSFDTNRLYNLLYEILNINEFNRGRSGIILGSDDNYSYFWSFTDFRFYFSEKIKRTSPDKDNLIEFYHDYRNALNLEKEGICQIDRKLFLDFKAVSINDFSFSFLDRKYFEQVFKYNGKYIAKNKQLESIKLLIDKRYCETERLETVISRLIDTVLDLDIEKLIDSYETKYDGSLITKVGGDDTYYESMDKGSYYSDPYIDTILPSEHSYKRQTGYTSNWGPSAVDLKRIKIEDEKQKEFARSHYNREKHIQFLIDNYFETLYENGKIIETYLRIKFAKSIYALFENQGLSGADLVKRMNLYIFPAFP